MAKTEKEILEYLKEVLVKGSTVEALCKELEISDFALYGYISKLKDQEIIVKVYEKSDKIEIKINQFINCLKLRFKHKFNNQKQTS